MKFCSKCNLSFEITMFSKNTRMKDGHNSWCKSCMNEYQRTSPLRKQTMRAWREQNVENRALSQKTWRSKNPENRLIDNYKRRSFILARGVFKVSVKELQKIKKQSCFYCGSTEQIQIDHVIPLARGGTHSIGNLVAACRLCNQSKGAKLLQEWKNK